MFKHMMTTPIFDELQKKIPEKIEQGLYSNEEEIKILEMEGHFITSNHRIKSEIQQNLDKWEYKLKIALAEQGYITEEEE